jgi:hypothetical protein
MKLVWVADHQYAEVPGGAEMSAEALLDSAPCEVPRLRSADVDADAIARHRGAHWLFGNYARLDLARFAASGERYSVIEFDYKFCTLRCIERHQDSPCLCASLPHGQGVLSFLSGAQMVWFMSALQREAHLVRCPQLADTSSVLSAPMRTSALQRLRELRRAGGPRSGWGLLDSSNWLKGTAQSLRWCASTGRQHVLLGGLAHGDLLNTLGRLEGLVHLPRGADTCPLLVTEAKLAGCALHLNELVQHAREPWFDRADLDAIEEHVAAIPSRFWRQVNS